MGYKNSEGYSDLTAGKAMRVADRMPTHIWNVFKELNRVAEKSKIKVTEIQDLETGRKYRKR